MGIAGAGEVSWRAFLAFCKGMQAAKKAFGKRYKMKAMIPDFIDGCNHGMKGVDLMDQSRKAFQSLRNCFRTWKPRWRFFLDATSSNCFRLSAYSPKRGRESHCRHCQPIQWLDQTGTRSGGGETGFLGRGSSVVLATLLFAGVTRALAGQST